ncbi:hypothetical protein N8885_01035 [Aquiluna sp.]|nr:hypothetical protein [Aquiluna sp.]
MEILSVAKVTEPSTNVNSMIRAGNSSMNSAVTAPRSLSNTNSTGDQIE